MASVPLLFDLAGANDELRFSPNCWRTRLALAHKGLPVETVAWRFTEKEAIAASGQGKVPVLVEGGRWLFESWVIAEYLEETYPDRPSLFGAPEGKALTRFINQWANENLHPAIARVIIADIFEVLHEKDKAYFRKTREAAYGTTIEALGAKQKEALLSLRQTLRPLRSTVAAQAYLCGDAPAYADHIVFGAFQWARVVSEVELVNAEDPVAGWIERMLDAYGGLARAAPRARAT